MDEVCCLIGLGTQGAQGIKADTGAVSTSTWQCNGHRKGCEKTSKVSGDVNGAQMQSVQTDTQLQVSDRFWVSNNGAQESSSAH